METQPSHKFIRTVCGDISPSELGFCHCHEHVVLRRGPSFIVNSSLLLDDTSASVKELNAFKTGASRWSDNATLVDAQPWCVERSATLLKQISDATTVHMIATTGLHRPCFYPTGYLNNLPYTMSIDELAQRFIDEVQTGMVEYDLTGDTPVEFTTSIKAGLVKFTSEYHHIPDFSRRAGEAAAICHLSTGVPIITHTERGTCPMEQIELVDCRGVNPGAMILSHVDRNPDRFLHEDILQTGAYVVYDGVARTKYWPDSVIVDLIIQMFSLGYGSQILLAMDVGPRTIWQSYGGGPGLTYLERTFLPKLRRAGLDDQAIRTLMIDNPKNALRFRQ